MTAVVAHDQQYMTIEEFLELEEHSLIKHQYVKGQVTPMPGGTLKHNIISSNIVTAINIAIRQHSRPFIVSNSDTKIWIPKIEAFYYPDAVVICEVPEYYEGRKDIILNPLLIVEVLSSSTEMRDKTSKFQDCATLTSFKEYVIVEQDSPMAQLSYRKDFSEAWQHSAMEGMEQQIELKSIGCFVAMRDIYDKTEIL